jgi:hypothetical protein
MLRCEVADRLGEAPPQLTQELESFSAIRYPDLNATLGNRALIQVVLRT